MSERNGRKAERGKSSDGQRSAKMDDGFIDGLHGKHGGGLESEGTPQTSLPESDKPIEDRRSDDEQRDRAPKNSERR